jgi:hypothetical protein
MVGAAKLLCCIETQCRVTVPTFLVSCLIRFLNACRDSSGRLDSSVFSFLRSFCLFMRISRIASLCNRCSLFSSSSHLSSLSRFSFRAIVCSIQYSSCQHGKTTALKKNECIEPRCSNSSGGSSLFVSSPLPNRLEAGSQAVVELFEGEYLAYQVVHKFKTNPYLCTFCIC